MSQLDQRIFLQASVNSRAASDLFEKMLKGPRKQKYNPTLRSNALTYAFYPPKGCTFEEKLPTKAYLIQILLLSGTDLSMRVQDSQKKP